jgi:hypothetical protein
MEARGQVVGGPRSGKTVKEIAGQLRLPRESLYRLPCDLRRTGAADDTALAVWVLRTTGSSDRRAGSAGDLWRKL